MILLCVAAIISAITAKAKLIPNNPKIICASLLVALAKEEVRYTYLTFFCAALVAWHVWKLKMENQPMNMVTNNTERESDDLLLDPLKRTMILQWLSGADFLNLTMIPWMEAAICLPLVGHFLLLIGLVLS